MSYSICGPINWNPQEKKSRVCKSMQKEAQKEASFFRALVIAQETSYW